MIRSNKKIIHSKYSRRYTPRHPLAKYAVNQIEKQERRAQDIVQAMGYLPQHTLAASDRLRQVLSSDILGLNDTGNDTGIDTHFTAHEFLIALLVVLDISYELFSADIVRIEYDLAHYPYPLPIYSLRADIDFEFTSGANWMSRGVASSKARVSLPESSAKTTDAERALIIQHYMNEHYKKFNGNLPYNGVIKGYWLIVEQRHEIISRVGYGLPKA